MEMTTAATQMTCGRCGQQFGCLRETINACWCAAEPYRLPTPLPLDVGDFNGCLCPACLRTVAKLLGMH